MKDLKKYLSSPPVLVAPYDGEELLLYISTTPQVVSAVLVVEREEKFGGRELQGMNDQRNSDPGSHKLDPGAQEEREEPRSIGHHGCLPGDLTKQTK